MCLCVVPVCIHKIKSVHICTFRGTKARAFVFVSLHVRGRDGRCVFERISRWLCVWLHLGADDSLGGSLYVGRQTKECRSVILGEILYYAAVVLGNKQRHMQVSRTRCHGGEARQQCSISKQHMQLHSMKKTKRMLVKHYNATPVCYCLIVTRVIVIRTDSSRIPTNMEQVFGRLI